MNGIVIIRSPTELRIIHRSVLSFVVLKPGKSRLDWQHIGDHFVLGFEADVLGDDDDETDYAEVAASMYRTITAPGICTQDVDWAWDAKTKLWSSYIAPRDLHLGRDQFLDEEHVGYGSLGR